LIGIKADAGGARIDAGQPVAGAYLQNDFFSMKRKNCA